MYGPMVRQIGPYYALGEMAMLHRGSVPTPRSATAVASETTTTLVVSQAIYNAVLRTRREASMRVRLSLLSRADPGASLPPKMRRSVAFALTPESMAAGKVLVRPGEPFKGLVMVAEGCLAVLSGAAEARSGAAVDTMQLLGRRGPGQMVGEDGLLNEGIHALTILAEVPSKVYRLAPQVLQPLSCLSYCSPTFSGTGSVDSCSNIF
jgi:CRP-like cAMP-binding protein